LAGAPLASFPATPPARISGSLNEPFEAASFPVSISLNCPSEIALKLIKPYLKT